MCGVEQVKYQIPGATGISLQLQMITLLGDAAAAGFTINLFNAQPIMSWPEPGCMALVMVLMKNTLMRIAVLSANCQSGAWTKTLKLTKSTMSASAFGYTSGWTTQQHDFCALSYFYLEDNRNQHCELKEDPINSGTWRLRADDASCRAVCVDF